MRQTEETEKSKITNHSNKNWKGNHWKIITPTKATLELFELRKAWCLCLSQSLCIFWIYFQRKFVLTTFLGIPNLEKRLSRLICVSREICLFGPLGLRGIQIFIFWRTQRIHRGHIFFFGRIIDNPWSVIVQDTFCHLCKSKWTFSTNK